MKNESKYESTSSPDSDKKVELTIILTALISEKEDILKKINNGEPQSQFDERLAQLKEEIEKTQNEIDFQISMDDMQKKIDDIEKRVKKSEKFREDLNRNKNKSNSPLGEAEIIKLSQLTEEKAEILRKIVKGELDSGVGGVLLDDLEVQIDAFEKRIPKPNKTQENQNPRISLSDLKKYGQYDSQELRTHSQRSENKGQVLHDSKYTQFDSKETYINALNSYVELESETTTLDDISCVAYIESYLINLTDASPENEKHLKKIGTYTEEVQKWVLKTIQAHSSTLELTQKDFDHYFSQAAVKQAETLGSKNKLSFLNFESSGSGSSRPSSTSGSSSLSSSSSSGVYSRSK